jgi:regulatory protein
LADLFDLPFLMMIMSDPTEKKKIYWSTNEARLNIERYCVYQDRCHQEVRSKLIEHGIYGDVLEEIISELISNNFLDEERFARSFARGKFNIKKWGRNKIKAELKARNVSPYCITLGLQEIEDDHYRDTIRATLLKKEKTSTFKNDFDRLQKLTSYAMSKGFEYETVREILSTLK